MSAPTAQALALRVTEAHGGLDAWHEPHARTVNFASGGLAFAAKGQGRALTDVRGTFATTTQQIALRSSTPVPWSYDVDDNDELRADVERLRRGRRRFRWTIQDIAAFASAAMWTYLNLPFVLHEPDVELHRLDDTQPLDRLAVTLPPRFTSHATHHVIHIDTDGRIRRHDYTANSISRLATASQHLGEYRRFGTIHVATGRRVVPRLRRRAFPRPTLVWIKIHDIGAG